MTATSTRSRPALSLTDLASCCSPTTGQILDQVEAQRLGGVAKAPAEPNRLRRVSVIAADGSGGATYECDPIEPVG